MSTPYNQLHTTAPVITDDDAPVLTVALSNSAETMASILARLNAINAARQHVFFDCSGIDVNPRLYLCTIMIDADANAVRVYDQVTGKLYVGPYVATETIGEVFAKAVDAYYSVVVTAATLDGVTVAGQTVTLRAGADASAPVYDTAPYNGSPVAFVVPKGFQYFVEITPGLAGHFSPSTVTGVANAPVSVTLTYQDTSNITDYIGLKGFLDTVAADPSLTTDAERIAFAQAALIPAAGGAKEIPDTFTNTAGTVYDNPMVVYAIDYVKGADGQMHLAALVQRKWCSSYDTQFDAPEGVECDSEMETAAEDGVYYYGLALGQTSKTAANLTLLALSPGDALPYADYAKIYKSSLHDTTRSSLQYGDNNWGRSAYRQHLNSSAAPGAWWTPTHVGDTAPSNLNSVRGYMAGCSAALLAAAKPIYVKTWLNYITDGANSLDTVYETLDTFFLPSGVEVYANVNMNGVYPVEGPLSEYWKIRMGLENPSVAAASTRIMYRELSVGSTANRSAVTVRLRSASRGNSYYVWHVNTSGQVSNYSHASFAYASVPACAIY